MPSLLQGPTKASFTPSSAEQKSREWSTTSLLSFLHTTCIMKSISTSLRSRQQLGGFVCGSCTRQIRRQQRSYATAAKSSLPDIYDVVCVGGGPAGLSLLAALRKSIATMEYEFANSLQALPRLPQTSESHWWRVKISAKSAHGPFLLHSSPIDAALLHRPLSAFSITSVLGIMSTEVVCRHTRKCRFGMG